MRGSVATRSRSGVALPGEYDRSSNLSIDWFPFLANSEKAQLISSEKVAFYRRDAYYMHVTPTLRESGDRCVVPREGFSALQVLEWAHKVNLPAAACFKATASGSSEPGS